MSLTTEQTAQYREAGFLIFDGLLGQEKAVHYVTLFNELVARSKTMTISDDAFNLAPDADGQPMPGQLHKIQGVCVVDERVLDLAKEPEILDRVSSLLGPNLDMFGSKFFPMRSAGRNIDTLASGQLLLWNQYRSDCELRHLFRGDRHGERMSAGHTRKPPDWRHRPTRRRQGECRARSVVGSGRE